MPRKDPPSYLYSTFTPPLYGFIGNSVPPTELRLHPDNLLPSYNHTITASLKILYSRKLFHLNFPAPLSLFRRIDIYIYYSSVPPLLLRDNSNQVYKSKDTQNGNMGDDVIENSTDIDAEVFKQILDMDDGDEEKEFSRTIVFDFFSQAEEKIEEMKVNLQQKNLDGLSSLGHFLKGSSATLGFTKIKDACEAIQHLGNGLDEHGQRMVTDPKDSLDRIQKKVDVMEVDCKLLRKILRRYYSMDPF